MALLMQMFRAGAITGNPNYVNAWFADRQGGRWAEQTMRRALPNPVRERQRKQLDEMRKQGAITEDEFEQLKARAGL